MQSVGGLRQWGTQYEMTGSKIWENLGMGSKVCEDIDIGNKAYENTESGEQSLRGFRV